MTRLLTLLFSACCLLLSSMNPVSAALPPEVKAELTELGRELRSVSTHVRKKEIAEAEAIIQKVEDRLKELAIPDDERDRSYGVLKSSLEKAKATIPVSFEKDIAAIVNGKCVKCHGDEQVCANLRLDTYANMGKGGRSGPLLIPGNPQRSLIMACITNNDPGVRMPKNAPQLSDEEIGTIARWIAGRAPFDGEDVNARAGDTLVEKKAPKPPVKVVMADGTETVSFKNDVAPTLMNVCLGCHSGNNPRGGFNMTTFEQLLSGGDTGNTIVPGDPDGSYIVDLTLRQKPIKMPAGNQTAIKRSQAEAIEKWVREGAHFDGTDPKAPLRSLVPTPEEIEAMKLASMSDSELAEQRKKQAESYWKRVAPRETPNVSETTNLYVYGDSPQTRLDEIAKWGEEQVSQLSGKYPVQGGGAVWRGRLIVFVAKTRFDYEEFNTVLLDRRTPRGINGHAVVSPNFADAYVAMQDVGDNASADALNSQQLLQSLVAQAYLSRTGAQLPDWLRQGFGLLESGAGPDSDFIRQIPQKASAAVSSISNPATLFDNGTFAPEEVGSIGLLLTRYLLTHGGPAKLKMLAQELQTKRIGEALQATYGQTAANLGQAFLQSGGR
ncbi:MAG: c-type cytochrome domain-containing protein [Planctomycetaceae bacterium]